MPRNRWGAFFLLRRFAHAHFFEAMPYSVMLRSLPDTDSSHWQPLCSETVLKRYIPHYLPWQVSYGSTNIMTSLTVDYQTLNNDVSFVPVTVPDCVWGRGGDGGVHEQSGDFRWCCRPDHSFRCQWCSWPHRGWRGPSTDSIVRPEPVPRHLRLWDHCGFVTISWLLESRRAGICSFWRKPWTALQTTL